MSLFDRLAGSAATLAAASGLALLFTGALIAQSGNGRNRSDVVVPSAQRSLDGSGVVLWAFAPWEARRQVILSDLSLGNLRNRTLRGLTVRRNVAPGADALGGRIRVRVSISETHAAPQEAQPRFDANRGATPVVVFDDIVDLPHRRAWSTDPTLPDWGGPDTVALPFTTPLALQGGRGLCIETETTLVLDRQGQPEAPFWPLDAAVRRLDPLVRDLGGSCIDPADPSPAAVSIGSLTTASTVRFNLSTPAGSPLLAVLNLGIGSGSGGLDLAGLGAPGCTSHVFALTTRQTSLAPLPGPGLRNLATADVWVPDIPVLSLVPLRSQWLLLHPTSNPLGVQTSNAFEFRMADARARQASWVEASDLGAAEGRVLADRQPVFQLLLQ